MFHARPVGLFALLAVLQASVAMADLSTKVRFSIGPQPLPAALRAYIEQSRIQVTTSSDLVEGRNTAGVTGELSALDALEVLLKSTGLTYRKIDESTVAIRTADARQTSSDTEAAAADNAALRPAEGGAESRNFRLAQAEAAAGESKSSDPQSERVEVEEVLVRGKPFTDANVDIVRTEDDVQPYYIFRGEEIAQANVSTVEEFLRHKLTMNATLYSNSQKVVEGNNFSQVSLRGLGTDQTLILLNGRRVSGKLSVSGYGGEQFDLNAISPAMIDRIEVLPSSASAIYGGSAVGGVLNVILKRDFTGGEVHLSYDTPLDANAPIRTASAAYGWSFQEGRTNLTLNGSFRDNESLLFEDRRRYVEHGYSRILERAPELRYGPGSPFRFGTTPNISSADGSDLTFKDGTPLNSPLTYVPVGTSPTTSAAQLQAGLLANAGQQNMALPSIACGFGGCLQTPFTSTGDASLAIGALRHKLTDRLELIGEFVYSKNDSVQVSSLNFPDEISASSPANPFEQDIIIQVPLSQAQSATRNENESVRAVAGFVMDLPNDWRAQGDYTWNRSKNSASRGPFLSFAAPVRAAIGDGTLNPLVDTLAFPLDLPAHTPQSVVFDGTSTLADIGLRLSGPVGRLPAGRPNLTIGLGHRTEAQPSANLLVGPFGHYSYYRMSQRVASAYGEALVPLISPANSKPGIRLLELQLAARVEDFSVDSGTPYQFTLPPDYTVDPNEVRVREKVDYRSTNTTVGLRFQPVESLTFRTSYATAFLPPNFPDFLPGIFIPSNLESGNDPRRGGELVEFNYLTGGNPDIKPMDAKTLNAGFVFEPTRWPGMRAGLEWFRIERRNLIFAPTLQEILDNEALYPGRVTREAAQPGDPYGVGRVTVVDAGLLNAQKVTTQGFDISLGLMRETERHGVFNLDLLGTIIDRFTYQAVLNSAAVDIAGKPYSDGGGGPLKVRANATLSWSKGPWRLGWTAVYFGPYDQYDDPSYLTAQGGNTVPSQIYHHLSAGYRFAEGAHPSGLAQVLNGVNVALGIRNVFNTLPPFDAGSSQTQYASPFGDYRLRSIQLSVSRSF